MTTHFTSHTPCLSSSQDVDVDDHDDNDYDYDDHQDVGGNVGNGDDNEEDVDDALMILYSTPPSR